MGQKIRKMTVMLTGMAFAVCSFGQSKAVKQQISNTAMAVSGELMYQMGAEDILADKEISMAQASFRYMLKSRDRQSREWQANFQNRMVYRMLVN